MSFGITIFLPEKKLSMKDYSAFLDDCSSILGEWRVLEHSSFNLNSDEIVHDCVLLDPSEKYVIQKKDVSVWVSLERRNFMKKYGRSRRKIYWAIYTETKAGRNFWSSAIQMLIPLKAFNHFPDIVVVADPETVFLHPRNYKDFVRRELVDLYGEESLASIGLLDTEANATNNSFNASGNSAALIRED
jgi:hypothetical protein